MSDRRRTGGGLFGVIGAVVGAGAEYNAHRKEQKQQRLSRENSQQDQTVEAGPSGSRQQASRSYSATSNPDSPPSYADVYAEGSERSLGSSGRPTDEKKAAMAQYDDEDSDDSDDSLSTEDDEEDWVLDEAVGSSRGLPSYEQSEAYSRTTDELVEDVLLTSRAEHRDEKPRLQQPLQLPVIIPQRRPGSKARGFVRAYSPVLEDAGIGQETFLTFLDDFDKASQASPVWTVIQVSAGIAGMAPSVIAMATSMAVQVAAGTAKEIQTRQRTNKYLDRMNQEFFRPAGLFAFVMKYKSDADVQNQGPSFASRFGIVKPEVVDLSTNQVIAKAFSGRPSSNSAGGSLSQQIKGLRLGSGTTRGTMQLPEVAPLIFPNIDRAVARDGAEETFKDKAKDARLFLADYIDRRKQMAYAQSDPNSILAVPEEQRAFKSSLADPNHPMYQGGLLNFATGGALSKNGELSGRAGKRERRAADRYERDERKVLRYEQRMGDGRRLSGKKQARYDRFMAERERRGSGGRDIIAERQGRCFGARSGYRDDYTQDRFSGRLGPRGGGRSGYQDDYTQDRFSGRLGPRGGGPVGLVGNLVSAVTSGRSRSQSREIDDTSDRQLQAQSQYAEDPRRRSYDSTQNARDPYARSPGSKNASAYTGYPRQRRQRGGGALGAVKRAMKEDVLYLMIVNYPSEQELAEARQEMDS